MELGAINAVALLDGLFALQLLLLALILHVISRILSTLKLHSSVSTSSVSTAAAASSKAAAPPPPPSDSGKPTIESLLPETGQAPSRPPAIEWSPISTIEFDVLKQMKAWFNSDGSKTFESLPFDMLIAFVRGYAYRTDASHAAFAYLDKNLEWRREGRFDGPPAPIMFATSAQLPSRPLFEQYVHSGPIGEDTDGHPVLLDRQMHVSPNDFHAAFDFDAYVRNMVYNREVQRAYLAAMSAKRKRRVYKCVIVMDIVGLSLAHLDNRTINLVRGFNRLFAYNYPETVQKLYIVNAPSIFTMAYRAIKKFLHPITVSKIEVCGANYEAVFARNGVKLWKGGIPSEPPSWTAEMAKLRLEHPEELLKRGYMSAEDKKAWRKHGLLR